MELPFTPFEAYNGDEPYIYVSYEHRDSGIVFGHIKRLRDEGFRIWYDEGINPDWDWPEQVAEAIANSCAFLAFISQKMVLSDNFKRELTFALNLKKQIIAVHIAKLELPGGVINDSFSSDDSKFKTLYEYSYADKEEFYERLISFLPRYTQKKDVKNLIHDRI